VKFPAELRLSLDHEGQAYVNVPVGGLAALGMPAASLLDAYKAALGAEVDAAAERLRASVMTPGAGQAMEYQETQAQAFAALADAASASAEKFPMLSASVGLDIDPETGAACVDVLGAARSVVQAYRQWQEVGAQIRRVRLSAKAAIAAASTPEDAALAAAPVWPALG
jgi:hypothetical protein